MIEFTRNRLFHLYSRNTSYIMRVTEEGILEHVYYGARIKDPAKSLRAIEKKHFSASGASLRLNKSTPSLSLSDMALECTTEGKGDYRTPLVSFSNRGLLDLRYRAHRAYPGVRKSKSALPSAHGDAKDAETLEILLSDEKAKIEVTLVYTLFRELDTFTRKTIIKNRSDEALVTEEANSLQLDLEEGDGKLTYLSGAWGREGWLKEKTVDEGKFALESRKWNSSSEISPSFAFENRFKEAYAVSLLWSSAFRCAIEKDSFHRTHITAGINPELFSFTLKKDAEWESPECALSFSSEGTYGACSILRSFAERQVKDKKTRDRLNPIMLSTDILGLDVNEERIRQLAKKAKETGIEGISVGDGWSGARKSLDQSKGDWYVNPMKFPSGMMALADEIHDMGLMFSLSFDIESMNRISNLYVKRPEWALSDKTRNEWSGLNDDLIMDLSNERCEDYVTESISKLIESYRLDGIVLSGSRSQSEITEKGDRAWRWMLGLYSVVRRLRRKYPSLFITYSMKGGARYDMGMLSYVDMVKMSENTDPVSRLKSLEGFSLFYPASTRILELSSSPDRNLSRYTDIESRFDMSLFGVIEYSLDIAKLSADETFSIKQQTEFYKEYRSALQRGSLRKYEETDEKAVFTLSDMKNGIFLVLYAVKSLEMNRPWDRIRIMEADAGATYTVTTRDRVQTEIRDSVYPQELECYEIMGDALSGAGIMLSEKDTGTGYTLESRKLSDHSTRLYIIRKEK